MSLNWNNDRQNKKYNLPRSIHDSFPALQLGNAIDDIIIPLYQWVGLESARGVFVSQSTGGNECCYKGSINRERMSRVVCVCVHV